MSKRKPYPVPESTEDSRVFWTSEEDLEAQLSKDPALKARMQAAAAEEFGAGDAEAMLDPVTRRNFLNLMGASIGLATLEGCRRPVEHIMPYSRAEERVNVGEANHFATAMEFRGDAIGLLVESHAGRPTKIEGNPDHPGSLGGADLFAQASVLDLYDPDRARQPSQKQESGARALKTYAEFDAAFGELMRTHSSDRGRNLRILTPPTISPTFVRLRQAVMARYPEARFHTWTAAPANSGRVGVEIATGTKANPVYHFDHAKVILSLDSDFMQTESGVVRNARRFAKGRRIESAADASSMSRLYAVESTYTPTGGAADHRLRMASRDIGPYFVALARELASKPGVQLSALTASLRGEAPAGVPAPWIGALASDLARAGRNAAVIVGASQPAWVHALAYAVNQALGALGTTVDYVPAFDADEPANYAQSLRELADAMGTTQTLIILGGNPVYDAPVDLDFGAKLERVPNSIYLGAQRDETAEKSKWHLPLAHYLETWGDLRGVDGVLSIQQPLIAPLFGGRAPIEVLAAMVNVETGPRFAYDLVRETFAQSPAAAVGGPDRSWRRALYRGVIAGTALAAQNAAPRATEIGQAITSGMEGQRAALSTTSLEVVFGVDRKMFDGREANNSWLQELPDPMTKITWDNAALFSPETARALGISNGDKVRLSKGNRSITIVAWILPGQANNSVYLPLGWGRKRAGRVGTERGFDVYPLRESTALYFMDGVTPAKANERYPISQTQEHARMEGRPIALEATVAEYQRQPTFGEHRSPTPRTLPLWREVDYSQGYKWGMSIDLNACTGCNACVVACIAENNIPVVGKDQVSRGREMHWLRVDRYFVSPRHWADRHDADPRAETDPDLAFQPLACVQCEEAPCENVCPVAATAHSPDGLNDMAYNRCIGTRYCANNCPYKVRRFNYLNWHNDWGTPWQQTVGEWAADSNVPETLRMQHNPNVTVRFRGVMEKCTYCVQRIQNAKILAKNEYRTLHDGEATTACAQTCPTEAIVFGDLNDRQSKAAKAARMDRRYKLLGEIGTQPRTTYLARIRNPNTEMQG